LRALKFFDALKNVRRVTIPERPNWHNS